MITTTSNKNLFLLYSLLDQYGYGRGEIDSHPLRRKTFDHFSPYKGPELHKRDYDHLSKPVGYVLTIEDAPNFSEIPITISSPETDRENRIGSVILPYLKYFYQNTDFEDYYQKILPLWNEEIVLIDEIVRNSKIDSLLDEVWQIKSPIEMIAIPMPLEARGSGIGPGFNNKSFQIFGPPFNASCLHILGHEGSHPRAKLLLEEMHELIDSKKYLFKRIEENTTCRLFYSDWNTYFEEHLIRAVQVAFISPIVSPEEETIESALQYEEREKGMIFIRKFYDCLVENKGKDLKETVKKIIDGL